jgi:uncharacterized protein (TIGR01777 family)
MKVAVSGSSGLIGSGLVPALEADGHEVVRLVRREASGRREISWRPDEGILDPKDLEGVDAVVNLAGAGIGDKRWTAERKAEVVASRVDGTSLLAKTIASMDDGPKVFASGSAVGWYGYDGGDTVKREGDPRGAGFLADVVEAWEDAAAPAEKEGVRVVLLRTGIVLSTAGGALAKQLKPFKLGLGGRLGSGRQWLPWVSLADEVAGIKRCLEDDSLSGPVNLCSPAPVTNLDFTKELGRAVHRPTLIPIPTRPLKALFGPEMVEEMFLGGNRVVPAKLEAAGFRWRHPTLDAALRDIL